MIKHHCLIKKLFTIAQTWKASQFLVIVIQKEYIYKEFKVNNLGDNLGLYVQINTLLLADVFGNFRNKCIEIYDPAHFVSAPGLAWKACLKKTEIKLELLPSIGMLLMFQKGTRSGICHSMHRHAKTNLSI